MSGIDEPSEFELLLDELERAADNAGARSESWPDPIDALDDDPGDDEVEDSGWDRPVTRLKETPRTLVDVRTLNVDEPLSHQLTWRDLDAAVDVGELIDHKYEILGTAPRSAGDAWEVRHVVLRQRFVLQLLARGAVDDPVRWPQFQRDIRAAGLLGHENIEFVTDLGRCDRYGAYLVKQWIEGPTLLEFLQSEGPRPETEAVDFAHGLGEALAALHEVGIVHGRLGPGSVRQVETTDGQVWKLLDVCLPRGDDELVAPEQLRGEARDPQTDQYALAYLTWQMLLGLGSEPDADASELPEDLVSVLRTALDEVPSRRWSDMDTFVAELTAALPQRPNPRLHPFDRREATRQVRRQAESREPAEEVDDEEFDERPRSMLIRVDNEESSPAVTVEFNTGARLRREYRRNMLRGGLFVPTAGALVVGESVDVSIRYPARDRSVVVRADVVTRDPGDDSRPPGYGVVFDHASRRRIEKFVRDLGFGLGLAPSLQLRAAKELDESADMQAGEAFLLSRLRGSTTVGAARAMFAGLPFDFDASLSTLIDRDFVVVESGAEDSEPAVDGRPGRPRPMPARAPERRGRQEEEEEASEQKASQRAAVAEKGEAKVAEKERAKDRSRELAVHEWNDVARVLETVAYFEEQGNFMAAGRVLESAVENAPDVAAYRHRRALHRARFDMDLEGARESIRAARQVDPRNDEIAAAERYIATLVEIAAVRVVWEGTLGGSSTWVRTEPGLGRVWFESRDQQITLVEVDYRSGATERVRRGAGSTVVAENRAEFEGLEQRKRVAFTTGSARRKRQIEIARRFGGFGPHFVSDPAADARSCNSIVEVRLDDGVELHRKGRASIRLSDEPGFDAVFSPDDQYIAWVERADEKWILLTSPTVGPAERRASFDARPDVYWSDDASMLVVVDHAASEVRVFDRARGAGRLVFDAAGTLDLTVLPSVDDGSALLVGRRVIGKTRWLATRVRLDSGDVLGEYELPDGVSDGVIRSDGRLAAVLLDGRLIVADLERETMNALEHTTPVPASVGRGWSIGQPLIVVELVEGAARVLSIDVDLLCG